MKYQRRRASERGSGGASEQRGDSLNEKSFTPLCIFLSGPAAAGKVLHVRSLSHHFLCVASTLESEHHPRSQEQQHLPLSEGKWLLLQGAGGAARLLLEEQQLI